MKQTYIQFLKDAFGQNEQKMKDYIIDGEIDKVKLENGELIPAEEFYHNIHKYLGE